MIEKEKNWKLKIKIDKGMTEKEFFSKICIVVEEVDESEYWLEVIKEADLTNDIEELERLRGESIEIIKIMSTAKNSTFTH